MSKNPLQLPPGVVRRGTEYQSKGRYYTAHLVRWHEGQLRPVGGWRVKSTSALLGSARALITWKESALNTWAAIGTHKRLHVMARSGVVTNITPRRRDVTLGANPFTTTNGSAVVTVHDVGHGATASAAVIYAGATAAGGITIVGEYFITAITDADNYTITHSAPATSGATGGGAAVSAKYEVNNGRVDATATGGYGSGLYGTGTYGTPRPDSSLISAANVWTLANFGQYLNACFDASGGIYEWQLNTANRAAIVTNAPTASAILVTEEGMLMALGAGGDPRKVQWSDSHANTVWTAAATNQAGDEVLETPGELMCGLRIHGGSLIFTDYDVHLCQPSRDQFVYAFERLDGENCGVISRHGAAAIPGRGAAWMGQDGFWLYNGTLQPLPCEVSDYVFSDINRLQVSKITVELNTAFGEVIWNYCSGGATEIDRKVIWNFRDNHWRFETAAPRLCGADKSAFTYPLRVHTTSGYVYDHEVGWTYDGGDMPYAETGPIELGNGEFVMEASQLVPDEKTQGDVNVTFYGRYYPNGAEYTFGPYTLANPTDVDFTATQVRMRVTGVRLTDWRWGIPRLVVSRGDPI